ncbi:hypothetical protein QE152_g30514 [Popillia japonica]|uniref:Uncharacterized protein n=1 Tax=Popillia japonica TaxID=7064 RepID=A0AAW1JE68_POPJA
MGICNRINAVNKALERANEKVVTAFQEDEFNEEFSKVLEYEDRVIEVLARLQIGLTSSPTKVIPVASTAPITASPRRYHKTSPENTGRCNVKFPKSDLSKFKSELTDWTLFWHISFELP